MHHPPFSQQHVHFQPQVQSAPMGAGSIGRRVGEHKGRLELRDVMPLGGVLLILLGVAGAAATIPDILAGTEAVTSLGFVPICVALGALLLWRTVRQMPFGLCCWSTAGFASIARATMRTDWP